MITSPRMCCVNGAQVTQVGCSFWRWYWRVPKKKKSWCILNWNMCQWLKWIFILFLFYWGIKAYFSHGKVFELNETDSMKECSLSIFQSCLLYSYTVKWFRMGTVKHKVIITCQHVRQALLQHFVQADFPCAQRVHSGYPASSPKHTRKPLAFCIPPTPSSLNDAIG